MIGMPFALIMVLAAFSDVRARRIPNALTMWGALAAVVLWGVIGGPSTALLSVAGGALALIVGIPVFALGAFGGGDVKLLVVTGAFLGPARLFVALLVIGIVGGLLALVVAIARRRLLSVLVSAWHLSVNLATLGRKGTSRDITSAGSITVPYGVAIAVGSLMTWYVYASALVAR